MLNALYTLANKYRNKKIYIWNINRHSIIVFTRVVLRKMDIQGFVTLQNEYAGETYMNRPVVTIEQIQEENYIILVSDEVPERDISVLPSDKTVYWSETLEFDKELRYQKSIIYGTGWGADKLYNQGIQPELYCVTKKENVVQTYRGKNVIDVSELDQYEDYAVIISVTTSQYKWEILEELSDFQGCIYLDSIMDDADILHVNLMQNLTFAVKNNWQIYLYSKKNPVAELLEAALRIYSVEISGYIYDTENKEKNIRSLYDLAFEGIEDKLVIICEGIPEKLVRALENIEFAGFSLEQKGYTGLLQASTYANEIILSKEQICHDPLIGYSISYLHGKPGWKLYGKEDGKRIRILVLGGSTSSEEMHPENWISKLYYKLKKQNIETVIYNGAHTCNDIVDEVLRLIRDGNILKPQIVISMSGVNNLNYKESSNQFNPSAFISWIRDMAPEENYCSGVYSDESLYDFWNRNQKLLKVISEFYGAVFLGFLQPMNITMKQMDLWEKSTYELEKHMIGARDFMCLANTNDNYINLMSLFEHRDEMYFDMCHYTDKAQEIIAEKVSEVIIPVIQNLYNKDN